MTFLGSARARAIQLTRSIAASNAHIRSREREIAEAQRALDEALKGAKVAKFNLDQAAARAELVALEDAGVLHPGDGFSDDPRNGRPRYEND